RARACGILRRRIDADLDLEGGEPFRLLLAGVDEIAVEIAAADDAEQRHALAHFLAQQRVHRRRGGVAGEVVQCDLDRGLGAVIAVHAPVHGGERAVDVARIAPVQHRRKVVDGGDDALQRLAGHHRRRRRLAPALGAVRGDDAHQYIVGAPHFLARHDHGLLHRQADGEGLDRADLHEDFRTASPLRRLQSFVMCAVSMMVLKVVISLVMRVHAAAPPFGRTRKPALKSFSFICGDDSTFRVAASSHFTCSGGVFAGASSAMSVAKTKSLKPASAMVGMSGKSGQRSSAHSARPRIVPARICGEAGPSEFEAICTVLVSSACSASPPPLNTTSSSFGRLARTFSSVACSCGVVPIGGTETLYLSGLLPAMSTNCFIDFAGDSLRTTKMFGTPASSLTATKSFIGSKGR